MPPNETSLLLTNYREKHILSSGRNGYGGNGSLTRDDASHVVQVAKDSTEYEPIFSIDDYCSSLTLAELLPYQDDPWWQRLRRIVLSAFWLILALTFVSACLMAYLKSDQVSCNITQHQLLSTTTTQLTTDAASSEADLLYTQAVTTTAESLTTAALDVGGKIAAP